MKASRSEFIELAGVRQHVRRWGDPAAPMIIMLHGWMDMSATFQFVVESLGRDWNIVAPDWPGFGLSHHTPGGYSLLQYCAHLEQLLDYYSPDAPVRVVAHSMGANIANIYFGARPHRLSRFVNIEGYAPVPDFFDGSLGQVVSRWLDHNARPRPERRYANYAQLTSRLLASNRRLEPDRAAFLASHLGVTGEDGLVRIAVDSAARFVSPISLHREQLMALWRDIDAPVLCVRGGKSFVSRAFAACPEDLDERIACLKHGREVVLPEGTHNLHHEIPGQLAQLIEPFLA